MSPTSYHCSTPQYIITKSFPTKGVMSPTSAENRQALLASIFEHPRKTCQIKDLTFFGTTTAPPRSIIVGANLTYKTQLPKERSIFLMLPKIKSEDWRTMWGNSAKAEPKTEVSKCLILPSSVSCLPSYKIKLVSLPVIKSWQHATGS